MTPPSTPPTSACACRLAWISLSSDVVWRTANHAAARCFRLGQHSVDTRCIGRPQLTGTGRKTKLAQDTRHCRQIDCVTHHPMGNDPVARPGGAIAEDHDLAAH